MKAFRRAGRGGCGAGRGGGGSGPGAGWLGAPQEAPAWRGGSLPQAPLLAPQRPLAEAPAGASRGVSSQVGGRSPPSRKGPEWGARAGVSRALFRHRQSTIARRGGLLRSASGGGSSDGAPGGHDRAPRLSCFSANFCRPGPSTHPPQGPTCLAGTPPQKCFPDETRARAPCGQLSRKALSTCHGGPLRRRAWRAWGAALSGQEQQLTTRAHTTVETPTVQLNGNSWKLVCTAHSRERPPLPPVLGVQGRAETAEAGVCQQPGGEGHVPQPRPGLEVLEAATLIAVGPPSIPGGAGVAGMRAAPDTRTTKLSRFPSMGSPGQHPVQN